MVIDYIHILSLSWSYWSLKNLSCEIVGFRLLQRLSVSVNIQQRESDFSPVLFKVFLLIVQILQVLVELMVGSAGAVWQVGQQPSFLLVDAVSSRETFGAFGTFLQYRLAKLGLTPPDVVGIYARARTVMDVASVVQYLNFIIDIFCITGTAGHNDSIQESE